MEIVVKAVKCGDSSSIYGDRQRLLIDCGSDNGNYGLKSSEFAYSSISDEIMDGQATDLLISHFHKDHFNGILEVPDSYRFNMTYLPYSIIEDKVIYTGPMARLLSIASSKSWGFCLAKNIMDLFQKLEQISGNIRFVKAGDVIPFDNTEIRVLWPDVKFTYDTLPVKYILEENNYSWFYVGDMTEELSKMETSLEDKFNEIIGGEEQGLLRAFNQFKEELDAYLGQLHNQTELRSSDNMNFLKVYETYKNLDFERKRFRANSSEEKLEMIKHFSRQQYHSLVTGMNAISIVCDCDNKFAYLGDAPADIIDHIKSEFKKQYKCVKIQHHGTDAYFTDKTPAGDHWIISNGGYKRRKVSDRFIRNGANIICTSAHLNAERFCNKNLCGPKCIMVMDSYTILL